MLSDKGFIKLFKFQKSTYKLKSRETSRLEFKESFSWNSKHKYAKTLAAFANNKGGLIIFGIKDTPRELVGLTNDKFENMDEAIITEYLNSVLSPSLEFQKTTIEIKGREVGFLEVHECIKKPVVCIKNDGLLKEAEIYYRYNARTEKIKYPELLDMINEIRDQESSKWKDLLKKMSKIDLSSLEIDIDENAMNKSEPSYLRITNDPSAPEVRVAEDNLLENYIDYYTLTNSLRSRYKNFKLDAKYHSIRKKYVNDSETYYCKSRLLDPNNPNSARKIFYHPDIVKEFDKHYKKK